jgi:predicted homoserine dehydrogenase-like protein
MIGLELGISVASAALRGEPTGCPQGFRADVIATAKRDLEVGEMLDGEGGETVWGSLVPAKSSLVEEGLPIGLAHGVTLTRPVAAGQRLSLGDVAIDRDEEALRLRRTALVG